MITNCGLNQAKRRNFGMLTLCITLLYFTCKNFVMINLIYFDRSFSELIQMNADCLYIALSAERIDSIVISELKSDYESIRNKSLVTSKYDQRTPYLTEPEFQRKQMIAPVEEPNVISQKFLVILTKY